MNKTFFDTLLIIILVFLLSLLFASFIKKLYINELLVSITFLRRLLQFCLERQLSLFES